METQQLKNIHQAIRILQDLAKDLSQQGVQNLPELPVNATLRQYADNKTHWKRNPPVLVLTATIQYYSVTTESHVVKIATVTHMMEPDTTLAHTWIVFLGKVIDTIEEITADGNKMNNLDIQVEHATSLPGVEEDPISSAVEVATAEDNKNPQSQDDAGSVPT